MTHRVVVTGLGLLSAIGNDVHSFWTSLLGSRHGFSTIQSVDVGRLRFSIGAEIHGFDPSGYFSAAQANMLDRASQFAVIAARQALNDSGIELTDELKLRTAVITGAATSGIHSHDLIAKELYNEGRKRIHPLSVPRIMANAPTSQICMDQGLMGPAYTVVTACSSGNNAIGQAFWMVRSGLVDVALTGGTEAPFSYIHLKAWEAMRVMASDLCRPFSSERTGMVLGEGAAMLVLERLEGALARNAPIVAELVGYGTSADATHITKPDGNGAARAIEAALLDAGLGTRRNQVGYVNAQGTGTMVSDAMEVRALRQVFGSHADQLAVSSTKSMHGHALGASNAFEAVATALALQKGILPPTANFLTPDPDCDLRVIPNHPELRSIDYAISNSFGFGGLNAVLVLRRWTE